MTEIQSTDYFAVVPEWLLYADISGNAVRLYAILNRYANTRGHAWPSRKTLADAMKCSPATVDRAREELQNVKAVTVVARRNPSGDPSSNLYILHTRPEDSNETSSQVRRGIPKSGERGITKDDDLTRANMKQSHKSSSSQMRTCQDCLGKNKTDFGYSGKWNHTTKTVDLCDTCDGEGKVTR